jgi:hypothetical protein
MAEFVISSYRDNMAEARICEVGAKSASVSESSNYSKKPSTAVTKVTIIMTVAFNTFNVSITEARSSQNAKMKNSCEHLCTPVLTSYKSCFTGQFTTYEVLLSASDHYDTRREICKSISIQHQ